MLCTWVGCGKPNATALLDKQKRHWCFLCPECNAAFSTILQSGDPKRILGAWIKAQGGAAKAAERI